MWSFSFVGSYSRSRGEEVGCRCVVAILFLGCVCWRRGRFAEISRIQISCSYNYMHIVALFLPENRTSGQPRFFAFFPFDFEIELTVWFRLDADEPISRINVWQLEGSTDQKDLLRFGINSENVELTAALICVDFTRPWKLVSSLQKWLDAIQTFVESLNVDPKRLTDLKQNCSFFSSFQNFFRPNQPNRWFNFLHQFEFLLPMFLSC
jgi:hypothetical protein